MRFLSFAVALGALFLPLTGIAEQAAGPAQVERMPAASPLRPFSTFAVQAELDKNLALDSIIVYRLHDSSEVALRKVFLQGSSAQYPELIQRLMEHQGFAGTVSDPVVNNLNDPEKPLTLVFRYHRVHDPAWGANRTSAAFGPTALPVVDDKNPPTSSIQLGPPRVEESVTNLHLPDGWSATLPAAVQEQLPQVRMETTYRLDGQTVHARRTMTVLSDAVPAADWRQYRRWYQASNAGSMPLIQLVPPGAVSSPRVTALADRPAAQAAPPAPVPAPKTEAERQAEASRLIANADEKLQRNEVDEAEKDLNAARELNPNQQGLSGDLGAIALRRGNAARALPLYRKEVELHPDSDFAWRAIVNLQLRDNLKAAETATRQWISASPDTIEPRATLVRVLWASQNNAAALTAAKEGSAALPGNLREGNDYQLLLGEAEVRGGDKTHGAEILSHLIQSDATPAQSNDANFELAQAHQQLPLAERTQREVLIKLGAETLRWTGEEAPETLRNGSALLTAAWDTMGWILYQEGKFTEAEAYLQAAWLNRPNPDIGEHLGDVQAALHQNREADRTYQLAYFTANEAPAAATSLKQKAAAATQRDRGNLDGSKPAEALAAERTFPIAGAAGLTGTAVYDMLFTRDGVLRIKAAPGGTTPAQDAKVREAKLARLFPAGEPAALFHTVTLICQGGACSVRVDQ